MKMRMCTCIDQAIRPNKALFPNGEDLSNAFDSPKSSGDKGRNAPETRGPRVVDPSRQWTSLHHWMTRVT